MAQLTMPMRKAELGNPTASDMKVWKCQSCLTLRDPMECSPPGSSVHGILQARVLKWVAISCSRGSRWPRDWTQVSCFAGRFFTVWTTREAHDIETHSGWRNSAAQTPRWAAWPSQVATTAVLALPLPGRPGLLSQQPSLNVPWPRAHWATTYASHDTAVCHGMLSRVWFSVIPWPVACQAALFVGFSWHFLPQGTFLTQGSNLSLLRHLYCRRTVCWLSRWGRLKTVDEQIKWQQLALKTQVKAHSLEWLQFKRLKIPSVD